MIPYGRQSINFSDVFGVAKQVAFRSLTQGTRIPEFEQNFANYVGSKYAVAVSSATAGLHLAVLAIELIPNSQIITSPISFVASSNAILYSKHRPLFIDIDKSSLNLDMKLVEQELNSNSLVKAIIPVHFAGLPCEMEQLAKLCNSKGIKIIEDAAHALGARYASGKKVGSCEFSDMTVFSFHPVKSITTGEGGMITTNSAELYKKLLRLRSHGINKLDDEFQLPLQASTKGVPNPWYYEMQELGFNYRMTEIQATLGISQLKRLSRFVQKRQSRVVWYQEALNPSLKFKPAQNTSTNTSAHHIFPIRIDFSKIMISRADLMKILKDRSVGSQVHYMPIPLHPYYQKLGYNVDKLPEAMSYYNEALTIPLYPNLKRFKQKRIVKILKEVIQ